MSLSGANSWFHIGLLGLQGHARIGLIRVELRNRSSGNATGDAESENGRPGWSMQVARLKQQTSDGKCRAVVDVQNMRRPHERHTSRHALLRTVVYRLWARLAAGCRIAIKSAAGVPAAALEQQIVSTAGTKQTAVPVFLVPCKHEALRCVQAVERLGVRSALWPRRPP